MLKTNRENFKLEEIEYTYISLMSKKIRIGIIGGGKAGIIKTKHFVENNCYVEVLAKSFHSKLIELSNKFNDRLKLINEEFTFEFLKDKHLIVIALDENKLKKEIINYCEANYKIYIDSSNFQEGMGVIPVQRTTKNIMFAINTKGGNPKGAVLVSKKAEELIEKYDDFIGYTTKLRNKAKEIPEHKNKIINFIGREGFKESYDNGNAENSLNENFPKEVVEYLLR